jgi:hypothetical protein
MVILALRLTVVESYRSNLAQVLVAFASSKPYNCAVDIFRLSALTTATTTTLGGSSAGHAR